MFENFMNLQTFFLFLVNVLRLGPSACVSEYLVLPFYRFYCNWNLSVNWIADFGIGIGMPGHKLPLSKAFGSQTKVLLKKF